MKTTQSGTLAHAIRVDEEFFRRLERLVEEFRDVCSRLLAQEYAITQDELLELPNTLPPSTEGMDESEVESYYENKERIRRLEFAGKLTINVEYFGDLKFQIEDLEELKELLRDQSGLTKDLNIHLGSLGPLTVHIYMGEFIFRNIRYSVEGPKADVRHLSNECRELISACKPEYPFLHSTYFGWVLSLLIAVSVFFSYVHFVSGRPDQSRNILFAFAPFVVAISVLLSRIPVALFRRAFPHVQVEYGPQAKKRNALVKAVIASLTLVILPWIINVMTK